MLEFADSTTLLPCQTTIASPPKLLRQPLFFHHGVDIEFSLARFAAAQGVGFVVADECFLGRIPGEFAFEFHADPRGGAV